MKKREYTILFLLILLIAFILVIRNNEKKTGFSYQIFKSESGWGYYIKYQNRNIIKQQYIPAIEGNIKFRDRRSARRTAIFVIERLKLNQTPTLTTEDLSRLNVLDNSGSFIK